MSTARGMTTNPTLLEELGQSGNDEAWRTFLGLYRPLILGRFRRMGLPPRHVEDVYDDVMFRLVQAMRGFVYDPTRRFRGWLKTLVKHEVWAFYRRKAREALVEPLGDHEVQDEVGELMGGSIEEVGLAFQVVERVRQRLQRDKPRDWDVFSAVVINDEDTHDVAERFGLKVGHIYVIINRVRGQLNGERAQASHDLDSDIGMEQVNELLSRLRQDG